MQEMIQGIFCREKTVRIGTGHTSRRTLQKTYWYVEEGDRAFSCWALAPNGERIGNPEICDTKQFLRFFLPEFTYPSPRDISESDLDMFRRLCMFLIENKDKESAQRFLTFILDIQKKLPFDVATFLLEIGTMFRKGKLFDVALMCYEHVQELGVKNPALYFNIARVYFDMEEYKQCITYLKESFTLSRQPSNAIKQLVEYLHNNALVPEECRDDINTMLNFYNGNKIQV